LRVVEGVSLRWVAPAERDDMVMLCVTLAHSTRCLIKPVSSFMALHAALLADPPVAFTDRLSRAGRVEGNAIVFASLAERGRERTLASPVDHGRRRGFSGPPLAPSVIEVAFAAAVFVFALPLRRVRLSLERFSTGDAGRLQGRVN
jgi:hypothetical protein